MARLIDADELKKAFDFDSDVELQCAVVHYGIDHAPTVDHSMKWIRCKDKLPEKEGHYLVSIFSGEFRHTNIATYVPKTNKWIPDSYGNWDHVKAWMPLPEPITYDEVSE